jgi:hypothetical protein
MVIYPDKPDKKKSGFKNTMFWLFEPARRQGADKKKILFLKKCTFAAAFDEPAP